MFWEHSPEKALILPLGIKEHMRQHNICLNDSLHREAGQGILGSEKACA